VFILYVSHVPVVTYEANGDPGASPAAHKIEKSNFFFCWVHDIIKKSFSSVHSLFLYVCAVQADYLRAAMPILRRNGPFYRVS